ncbi:MAG TPA: carboxypeptidase-like regulatory domain-containing protein [Myxococcota bacterium]|nr:carboxypeptidase-like regulatory domain-containing protein [Myxococcota bacterium]
MRRRALVRSVLAAVAALACAGAPPAPGKARVFGTLRLVPHEGAPHPSAGGAYGSLRMRDAGLVDYSKPGFAVVYVAEDAKPGGTATIEIRDTQVETRLVPDALAIGDGGQITVVNASASAHIVSYPAAGLVKRLAARERLEIAVPAAGEQGLFLLDVPEATATLFAAPGRFAVVSTSGDYELPDLDPGATVLRAWHPRFPPVARHVDLAPDTALRVDLQMGVGIEGEATSR